MDMSRLPAYELVKQERIDDVQSEGYLLRHKKSGARVLLLDNEDENKVFSIAFRTTPSDSTGVAHIMEHSVLCGSRRFPAKDPFVELVKGSMNTFLNAMTYPDKTLYPVASCNDADFANLMHVYLDAVFFPNIYQKEEIFRQEGWSYQIEDPQEELVYNGVVYNEMKGAFSSPEDVLEREILNSLFPDNTYHYESGGDPECIPDLTYEEFLDFHRRYYHPSNSYIYLYGKMDFEERLNWMDQEYLSLFEYRPVDSEVVLQKPFAQPAVVRRSYSIGQNDTEEDNTYLSYNVAVGTSADTKLAGAFAVLEYVLLEAPGAPLKEALLDAGIGRDIMSSYDSGIRQPVFSIIAKNANASDEERFRGLIREKLEEIASAGIDQNAILAAINIMEFKFREADYGNFPKGLMYGIDVFDSWLYDEGRPFDYLRQLDDFAWLKEQNGSGHYEQLIRTWILENPHTSFVTVLPERGMTARMEEATAKKLRQVKEAMSPEQIAEQIENTKRLRAFQETPSTKEELEAIPMLSREDLGRNARPFSNEELNWDGVQALYHDYPTNGIAYFTLLFDASGLSREELPYLGILKSVLTMVSTEHYDYSELYNEINRNTGGISPGVSVFPDEWDTTRMKTAFGIQVRTLYDKIEYCFDMIGEILFTSDLRQEKRLKEIISKLKSRTSVALNASGNSTVGLRLLSYFSPVSLFTDCISGVEFYRAVAEIDKSFEEKKEELKDRLQQVLAKVLRKDGLMVDYTGDAEVLPRIRAGVERLAGRLAADGRAQSAIEETDHAQSCHSGTQDMADGRAQAGSPISGLKYYTGLVPERKNEGFLTPAKIQFVAKGGNFRREGFTYTGAMRVLRVIMNYEYLWTNLRVVGGAYGCGGSFNRNGDTCFTSFRDPHLKKTLEVYDGIPEYLENFEADERDMTKYTIGTVSSMDAPMTPAALGRRSLHAWMSGLTLETLQKEREEVLNVTPEDIRALAPAVRAVLSQDCVCVLGNEEKLKGAKEVFLRLEEL